MGRPLFGTGTAQPSSDVHDPSCVCSSCITVPRPAPASPAEAPTAIPVLQPLQSTEPSIAPIQADSTQLYASTLQDLSETQNQLRQASAALEAAFLRLQALRASLRALPARMSRLESQLGLQTSPASVPDPTTASALPASSPSTANTDGNASAIGPRHSAILLAGNGAEVQEADDDSSSTMLPPETMSDLLTTIPPPIRETLLRASIEPATPAAAPPSTTSRPTVSPAPASRLVPEPFRSTGWSWADNAATPRRPLSSLIYSTSSRDSNAAGSPVLPALAATPINSQARTSHARVPSHIHPGWLTAGATPAGPLLSHRLFPPNNAVGQAARSDDGRTTRGRRVAALEQAARANSSNALATSATTLPSRASSPPPLVSMSTAASTMPSTIPLLERTTALASDLRSTLDRLARVPRPTVPSRSGSGTPMPTGSNSIGLGPSIRRRESTPIQTAEGGSDFGDGLGARMRWAALRDRSERMRPEAFIRHFRESLAQMPGNSSAVATGSEATGSQTVSSSEARRDGSPMTAYNAMYGPHFAPSPPSSHAEPGLRWTVQEDDPASGRTYRVRRRLLPNGQEYVHSMVFENGIGEDQSSSVTSRPINGMRENRTPTSWYRENMLSGSDRMQRRITPGPLATPTPGVMEVDRNGNPSFVGRPSAATREASPRHRRGWARLDADGNEVSTDDEIGLEQARARERMFLTRMRRMASESGRFHRPNPSQPFPQNQDQNQTQTTNESGTSSDSDPAVVVPVPPSMTATARRSSASLLDRLPAVPLDMIRRDLDRDREQSEESENRRADLLLYESFRMSSDGDVEAMFSRVLADHEREASPARQPEGDSSGGGQMEEMDREWYGSDITFEPCPLPISLEEMMPGRKRRVEYGLPSTGARARKREGAARINYVPDIAGR